MLRNPRAKRIDQNRRYGTVPFRPLIVEKLEDRLPLSVTMSIGDASAIEGSKSLKFIDTFVSDGSGGLMRPRTSEFGPDGNRDGVEDLYVPSVDTNQVLRYDGKTGAFLDVFVAASSGGLAGPGDVAFGPDGNLYVSSNNSGDVLRYDGTSGAFIAPVASGLSRPMGLTFGNDGSLFIAAQDSDQVYQFSNSSLSVFVTAGSGGLDRPNRAVFGPDGNMYVVSAFTKQILRYNGATGAFIDVFIDTTQATPGNAIWPEFGTDGFLYLAQWTTTVCCDTSIARYDANSGAFIDRLDLGEDHWSFQLGPENLIYLSGNGGGNAVERYGASSLTAFTVSLSSPSISPLTVDFTTASGTATAASDFADLSGTVTFAPGQTTRTILVPTLDDAATESTETFTVNLTNPVGATIADGVGVGTILDNDPFTKFYVVNDGSPDRTYEYSDAGAAVENYSLNSGNSAPRGAASNIAGTRVWVVDDNKKVYVYDSNGGLSGSWTAGSLSSNAAPEGIATNGTDVWIVDAKSDKVFKYAGAASLTSGSQNAASSFTLNSSNTSPKDIVTDGTYVWVVNDSGSDKVFKYTLSGTLVGSWTMSTSGAGSPTGITIDPSNVSDIWIVDSSADKVFQYTAAASRTSGSQSATASFVLAAGNTNPQGIADPPPLGAMQHDQQDAASLPVANVTDMALGQLVDDSVRRQSSSPRAIDRADQPPLRTTSAPARVPTEFAPGQATLPSPSEIQHSTRAQRQIASLDDLFAGWERDDIAVLGEL